MLRVNLDMPYILSWGSTVWYSQKTIGTTIAALTDAPTVNQRLLAKRGRETTVAIMSKVGSTQNSSV